MLTAILALLIGVLWCLGVVFLIDVIFEMTVLQRIAIFAVTLGVLVWVYVRYAAPWLGISESMIDMALLVENQQKIESDLVASLQFESPQARRWGSVQLEEEVINHVGQSSRELNVFAGMDYSTLGRRMVVALLTIVLAVAIVFVFPAYSKVFLSRLLLSPAHYPTKTVIESLEINGQEISIAPQDRSVIRMGYGRPVEFTVHCSGVIPEEGEAQLYSSVSGKKNPIILSREKDGAKVFRGKLERLLDDVTYKLYLGDAWTDAREISVIPLPAIKPDFTETPPGYAQAAAASDPSDPNALQRSVLESTRVTVEFESSKPLERADLTVEVGSESTEYRLSPVGDDARRWALTDKGTAFDRVEKVIRYSLQVQDRDKLQLESPLKGTVRLKTDRWPQVSGNLVHRVVLPTAKPVVELRASDDYGLAELVLDVQIVRTRDKSGMEGMSEQTITTKRLPITTVLAPANGKTNGLSPSDSSGRESRPLEFPVRGESLPITGGYRLELGKLDLVKGDQLRLTLEATDYRGKLPGRMAQGEPLLLEVSDESGVLAAIVEADETSEARISELIRRQLGIGESP